MFLMIDVFTSNIFLLLVARAHDSHLSSQALMHSESSSSRCNISPCLVRLGKWHKHRQLAGWQPGCCIHHITITKILKGLEDNHLTLNLE